MNGLIDRLIQLWIKKIVCGGDPIRYACYKGVKIGGICRLLTDVDLPFGSEPYLISPGDHVSVIGGVRFLNHDGGVWVFRGLSPDIDYFSRIVVGDNVFICMNVIVMPGVTIGSNTIIGAGPVVAKDVPPSTVVAGAPAKVIMDIERYRTTRKGHKVTVKGFSAVAKRRALEISVLECNTLLESPQGRLQ